MMQQIGIVANIILTVIFIIEYYKLKKYCKRLKQKALIERLPVVEKYYQLGKFKEGDEVHHISVTGEVKNGYIKTINEYTYTELIFVVFENEDFSHAFSPQQLEKGWQ